MRTIIKLLFLLLIIGCKNKQPSKLKMKNTPEQKAIKTKTNSRKELSLDSILKIEKDSLLLSKILEYKTNKIIIDIEPELEPDEDYSEGQSIYGGEIIYSTDSILKVVNVFREYSGGATYNPYAENIIIKNNNLITSKIEGEIFRIDKYKNNEYLFYVNNYSRLSNHIKIFKSSFQNDSLITNKVNKKNYGNYLFNFIKHKKEHPDSINIKIDLKNWNNSETLKSLDLVNSKIGLNEYYKTSYEPFLEIEIDENKEIEPQFIIYYKHSYGDQLEKFLRIQNKDRPTDFILAMKGGDSFTEKINTEFINDSIFKKTFVFTESNHENGKDLEFSVDSIITIYKYNKLFEFKEIEKDSIHYIRK